jgi:hypothetical protein
MARRLTNAASAAGSEAVGGMLMAQNKPSSSITPADPGPLDAVEGLEKSHRVSEILDAVAHSFFDYVLQTNLLALLASAITIALIALFFLLLEQIAEATGTHLPSASVFLGMLVFTFSVLVLRWEEQAFRKDMLSLSIPSAVLASISMLALTGGDPNALTIPLLMFMMAFQSSVVWLNEPTPRPNYLVYFFVCLPMAIFCTVMCLLPPFMVAVPGRLLVKHPRAYAAWCGVGYPTFAFVLRKTGLAYIIFYCMESVEKGKLKPREVLPFVSKCSFAISSTLNYGNVILLYLTESEEFAVASSVASIFTETAGKMYAVWATRRAMAAYLSTVVMTNSSRLGKVITRAQMEPGVAGATKLGRANTGLLQDQPVNEQIAALMEKQIGLLEEIAKKDLEIENRDKAIAGNTMLIKLMREEIERLGGTCGVPEDSWKEAGVEGGKEGGEEDGEADAIIDKMMTKEYWEDINAMFALRWGNEIVSEKVCIITGGFVTGTLIKSPHCTRTQIVLAAIFFVAELLADALMVYVLDKKYGIPFLKLPHEDLRDTKYWQNVTFAALIIASGTFIFFFAFHTAQVWIPHEVKSLVNSTANVANTTAGCVPVEVCETVCEAVG